jgi:site-specific DNA-methyltransferase (adenine-specific)
MESGESYDKGIRKYSKGNYGQFNDSIAKNETGARHPKSILKVSNADRQNKKHPTQKPIAIIEYLLRTYADTSFKVFDPFMGSGTTAVACQSLGLEWCGCELEADYVAIANKRLEAVQGSLF